MASKDVVEDMLTLFCSMHGKRFSNDLISAYNLALIDYSDDQVRKGGHRAMEECERFPKPVDIIQRASIEKAQGRELYPMFGKEVCHLCEQVKFCMKEDEYSRWECRQCYGGLSDDEIRARYRKILNTIERKSLHKAIEPKRKKQPLFAE